MEQEYSCPRTAQGTSEPCSRKLKLKFSCDSCAKSKLKCGKQQPICQRCLMQGVRCVYSPARRTGKRRAPPKSQSSASNGCPAIAAPSVLSPGGQLDLQDLAIAILPPVEEAASLHLSGSWVSRFPTPHSEPFHRPDYSDRLVTTAMEERELVAWKNYSAESRSSIGLGIGAFPVWNECTDIESDQHINFGLRLTPGLGSCSMGPPSGSDPTPLDDEEATLNYHMVRDSAESKKSPSSSNSISTNTPIAGREGCALFALSILRDLHCPSTSCASASSLPNSTNCDIDHMLQTAKQATEKAMTILRCRCSLDSHLALLLTLISSEILSSYELIARNIMEGWTSASAKSNSSSSPHMSLPINIGSFQLDAADESKMVLQLVLIQLGKVRDLQAAFMKRYLRLSEGERKEQLQLVCITFLETRLKSVMRVLTQNLRK
jgi:hypothetical protein